MCGTHFWVMFKGYLLYLDSFSFSLPIHFFLVVVTTTVSSTHTHTNAIVLQGATHIYIQNFVYTSFALQKFVYAFLKSVSFLKTGLIQVFSCQNFDGSTILFYTKDSVSTSWEYASEWMNVFSYCCLFEIIGNVPRLLGFLT